MSLQETMKNLLKLAYLLHQLLCAVELQNVITGLSKDNELKKKKGPTTKISTLPSVSSVMCNPHGFHTINNPLRFLKLY